MAAELITSEEIAEAAKGAQSFTADGVSVQQVPVPDQIAADKYIKGLAAVPAARTGWAALRIARFTAPGADPT